MRSGDRSERRSGRLRSKRGLPSWIAVAALTLHSALARAEEIVQPDPVSGQVFFNAVDTNGQQQKISVPLTSAFDRFDPSLGELAQIEYAWDYRFRVTLDVASTGGGSGGATGPIQINGMTTISGGGGGNGDGSDTPGVLVVDFAVTGSTAIDPLVAPDSFVLPFLGAPGASVDLVYTPELSATSTGDSVVTLALLDGSSTTLRYVYAPEPTAALTALAALSALAALARSARR